MNLRILRVILVGVLSNLLSYSANASSQIGYEQRDLTPPRTSNNNIFFDTERDIPEGSIKTLMIPGTVSFRIGLRHDLPSSWSMAVSLQYKSFVSKEVGSSLVVPNIAQDCLYRTMIYHPWYMHLGTRIYYFFPTEKLSFPLHSSPTFKRQLGVGFFVSQVYSIKNYFATLNIERYRGIQDDRIHGYSIGMGIGANL